MSDAEFHEAVEALWRASKTSPNLYETPAFIALRQLCQKVYPNAGSKQSIDFALSQAIYNLGFRWGESNPSHYAVQSNIAAERIGSAFRQTHSRRIHLCPLDLADKMPLRRFGVNSIRSFTADELNRFTDPHGVIARFPDKRLDSERLSQFMWLVVEESVDLPGDPEARALPSLFSEIGWDPGSIKPHRSQYPRAVEAALFALLTAPWEDITVHCEFDWRPFRVPWVYTFDDDLFARLPVMPSADSLSWETQFYQEGQGEMIEFECPRRLFLEDDADEKTSYLTDEAWQEIVAAMKSPLFSGPVMHFFVRAFSADNIDEFLAHILVIEAGLGLSKDHLRQPKLARNPGATARVGSRLACLLNDPRARERYEKLFAERSSFIHGRTMNDISAASRLDARRLARQCVCALISVAISEGVPASREAFLDDILEKYWLAT